MKSLFSASLMAVVLFLSSSVKANEAEIKQLQKTLPSVFPNLPNPSVKATPVKGLYEVMVGNQIMYMTKDASYALDGNMFDLKSKLNLTEATRGKIRLDAVNKLGEENMVVYKPKGDTKHTITVFTDIYCPYCVRLHNEMDEYEKNGVKVRYIFVPFKGKKSVEASVSVWCADDQNEAMTLAKSGVEIEKKTCDNPVLKHQALASELGIRGTPAIMLESGALMPGYVPATKLIAQLDQAK